MIRNARYRHPYEFQIVIDAPMAQIADILGEFGYRVCAGYQFEPDDVRRHSGGRFPVSVGPTYGPSVPPRSEDRLPGWTRPVARARQVQLWLCPAKCADAAVAEPQTVAGKSELGESAKNGQEKKNRCPNGASESG